MELASAYTRTHTHEHACVLHARAYTMHTYTHEDAHAPHTCTHTCTQRQEVPTEDAARCQGWSRNCRPRPTSELRSSGESGSGAVLMGFTLDLYKSVSRMKLKHNFRDIRASVFPLIIVFATTYHFVMDNLCTYIRNFLKMLYEEIFLTYHTFRYYRTPNQWP